LDKDVLLVGYPSATLKKDGMKLSGKPTSYRTSVMATAPQSARQPVSAELDLFLVLDREGVSFSGERFCSPAIGGMSGCAIWQFTEVQNTELWMPDPTALFPSVRNRLEGVMRQCGTGSTRGRNADQHRFGV
jgi:hypothetical protein